MTQKTVQDIDRIDAAILRVLQRDASLSQREVAEKVGLSQNACWRRMVRLRETGVIEGQTVRLELTRLGLGLTVFVMVRTRDHSPEWLKQFRRTVLAIENVIDFFRVAGDYDYMLKIVARDMNDFEVGGGSGGGEPGRAAGRAPRACTRAVGTSPRTGAAARPPGTSSGDGSASSMESAGHPTAFDGNDEAARASFHLVATSPRP